ncbi:MAG: Gfo/Idh/MocA family protein [Phycisphaerae bacterium]
MPLRIGIVGLGIMGAIHARYLFNNEIPNARLAALCSRDPKKRAAAAADFPDIPTFLHLEDLLASQTCDALLIVTPHLDHPAMLRAALAANLHVLVEKPLAVSLSHAHALLADIARHPHLTVGIVYNQRTNPLYQKIRELLAAQTLGQLTRIDWLVTNWFRTNAYYQLAPWRSSWNLGGGGLLINQSHHHLDLLRWLTNLAPTQVTAIVTPGKFHPIQVEDDVHAFIEFAPQTPDSGRGAIAHFATTTGEFPGTNRLEIAGTRGKLVAENQSLSLTTLPEDTTHTIATNPNPFATPAYAATTLTFPPSTTEYQSLTQNFVNAITQKSPLLAPATDAPLAIELANAITLAGLTRIPIPLPLNPTLYDTFLTQQSPTAPPRSDH